MIHFMVIYSVLLLFCSLSPGRIDRMPLIFAIFSIWIRHFGYKFVDRIFNSVEQSWLSNSFYIQIFIKLNLFSKNISLTASDMWTSDNRRVLDAMLSLLIAIASIVSKLSPLQTIDSKPYSVCWVCVFFADFRLYYYWIFNLNNLFYLK